MDKKRSELNRQVQRGFTYANGLRMFINTVLQSSQPKEYLAYFICLDSFASRLMSYTSFVYEDLSKKNAPILAKSFANLIYLRGCLEATLIINILLNNYTYGEKFLANCNSDITHIHATYKTSAPNHELNYQAFFDLEETHPFARRFSWLPKYNKKSPFNLNDLLNYVNFDDPNIKDSYRFFIRFFDSYSHPSFYIPTLFNSPTLSNFGDVANLFIDNGIIDSWISFINNTLAKIFKDTPYANGVDFLSALAAEKEKPSYIDKIKNFAEFSEELFSSSCDIPACCSFFTHHYDIERYIYGRASTYPHYLAQNSLGISLLVYAIKAKTGLKTYKAQCLYLLLQDASLRLADFHRAYHDSNYESFYILARYLIEFLVTSFVLLNDDEERSKIYFIHQLIKGYQASKISEEEHLQNIQTIKSYYADNFSLNVSESTIMRLNGWAIYLPNLENTDNLNFPALTQYAITHLINELIKATSTHYQEEVVETIDFVQGFYEEACAYCHITTYGWNNNLHLYRSNTIFKEQYAIINSLFNQLFQTLIVSFDLPSEPVYFEKVSSTLLKGMESLLQDLLKEHD